MAQTSSQKCYICTDKYSVFYCYECQHALCAVCRERHDKIPAVSGHTITDINGIDLSNVQSDNTRYDIPKEPTLPYVPSLNKTMLYTEILEYIQSKTDTSLCKNCFSKEEKLVEIVEENRQLKRDVDEKAVGLTAESNEVRRLRISFKDMEIKYAKKEEENESLSKEIKLLKERDVDEKTVELKAESNEVRRLRISFKDMETKYAKKEEENESLSKEIRLLKKGYVMN
ncbi:unnamed protein product [Mytilus coruscus]|uniref:B box-type domain-containing protein n=1 Tax=Mytilus coruscus TaxID=42192 RepID=A0A6J8DND1_MYTCO|nr:unnamed protein product [Mytilus coruscus]